ncbi:MAG: sugar phosphate isomerase/epimerase [Clostridia bacterium]|nr:sugar phosphate isomerase/epimerase [Clostridia bacterium]
MAKVRLCAFADEACPNLDGQISALKRNNISLLEIRGVNGKNIKDLSYDEVREVKAKLDMAGIGVWSIGSPVGKADTDKDWDVQTESFKKLCDFAKILGAEKIRMFSFYSKDWDRVKARLCELVALTPEGITLCHENEKGIYGDTTDCCEQIQRTIPQLRAVFDPANLVQCGQDTKAAWQTLNPYVDYLHIKDALASGQVVPAGEGIGNLEFIIDSYIKMGGEVMTLEPHLTEFCGLKDLENGESMSEEKRYATEDEAFDAGVYALKQILDRLGVEY